MATAIRIHAHGGPDVLTYEEIEVAAPGPGEVRLTQTAIGLNFIDTYYRTGLYKPPALPFIPGGEGAGVVESVGPGVSDLKPGDRVAYATGLGGYASVRLMPADRLVRVPDVISDATAAAMMLKGMTARYLLRATYTVKPGSVILFHAAAGGVGLIAGQWARALGATVIGTAGSADKVKLALEHGYHHVINYRDENFVTRVKELTGGRGVDVVYDSVGRDTFAGSLDCLKPRGLFVSFGNASGPAPDISLLTLAQKGSLFVTRPTLFTYIASRADLEETAADLMAVVADGTVRIPVSQTYALKDAARAHSDLEGRMTTGASVLLP